MRISVERRSLVGRLGQVGTHFKPGGAEAVRRYLSNATAQFLPTGHFGWKLIEEIVWAMCTLLARTGHPIAIGKISAIPRSVYEPVASKESEWTIELFSC